MKESQAACFEELKRILKHIRDPESLDDHPWTRSLIVQEALVKTPALAKANPGQHLIGAFAGLFLQLQPLNPPRSGKRLDPRWGEFGLLAALYFTPFNHGTPFPTTLLEAWRQIDPAILYHVYGKPPEELGDEQTSRYRLVGSELEFGSTSTLSDWHKKGLQRFAELILNRERYLNRTEDKPSPILSPTVEGATGEHSPLTGSHIENRKRWMPARRWVWWSLILVVLAGLCFGAVKGWRIYEKGRPVYEDLNQLQEVIQAPLKVTDLEAALPRLVKLQEDLQVFLQEAQPLVDLGPRMRWVPVYGGDLSAAPALAELAEHLVEASVVSLQAAQPLLDEFTSRESLLDPPRMTALLVDAQPQLLESRKELEQALIARGSIETGKLSPRLRNLLVERLDPLLAQAQDGLSLATVLPGILGATREGPKTYLLLVQNEDELRPTGGFITSVGNLVIRNGGVISLDFERVDDQEDWSKPYPAAPWQLQEYMNSSVLILRDSNWFADFPTSVLWAEYFYAYNHSHSVDGVIAFDQQFLVMLLGVMGPLEVEGAPYPITSSNVIQYMRAAKSPPVDGPVPPDWYRKEFIEDIADAVLREMVSGPKNDWRRIAETVLQALEQRHLLLQFDDPEVNSLLAGHGWDNAVRPTDGDFLLTTDTNIGFNKTNALVEVSLSYDVDLSDLSAPRGVLIVTHTNNAASDVPCIHWNTGEISGEEFYPMNRCYWNYLRVYKQAGVQLLDASPHAIPAEWMLLGQAVPARVDELDEGLDGVQGFGTLLVVPGGQTWNTGFSFALPPSVLNHMPDTTRYSYHLEIRKQPGTRANPVVIRVHLPNRSRLAYTSMDAIIQNDNLLIRTDLLTDVELALDFDLP